MNDEFKISLHLEISFKKMKSTSFLFLKTKDACEVDRI
jgi:hypothetical protein